MDKTGKTRKRKNADFDAVAEIFSNNLWTLIREADSNSPFRAQRSIAILAGCTAHTVNTWLNKTAIPETDKLYTLAKAAGVTTDWLLTEHGSKAAKQKIEYTYVTAAIHIQNFIKLNLLDPKQIRDPFIAYYIRENERLSHISNQSRYEAWKDRVLVAFEIPILPAQIANESNYKETVSIASEGSTDEETVLTTLSMMKEFVSLANDRNNYRMVIGPRAMSYIEWVKTKAGKNENQDDALFLEEYMLHHVEKEKEN